MKFITESGSVYEVNTDSNKCRRLEGKKNPTPRQGKDGEWRSFEAIEPNPIRVGACVIILWGLCEPTEETKSLYPNVKEVPGITRTSHVVEIEP